MAASQSGLHQRVVQGGSRGGMGSTVQPTPGENPAGPRRGAQATDGGDHQGNHQEKPP